MDFKFGAGLLARIGTRRFARGARVSAACGVAVVVVAAGNAYGSDSVAVPSVRINSGSTAAVKTAIGTFAADHSFIGGRSYAAKASTAIANTSDDELYRTYRLGVSGYRIAVPAAGTYQVDLHLSELQSGGNGKRVFSVNAEGKTVIPQLDIHKDHGRYTAAVRSFTVTVTVNDGFVDLGFTKLAELDTAIAGVAVKPKQVASVTTTSRLPTTTALATTTTTKAPTTTSAPTTPAPSTSVAPTTTSAPTPTTGLPTPLPISSEFPTLETTGPRVGYSAMKASGGVTSSYDGQIIDKMDITGNVRIKHDNVIVRDSRVKMTATYGLNVIKKADGSCPQGVRYEYVEVDGALALENDIPIYSASCGFVFDRGWVHNVGRSSRMTNDTTISNSYIFSNRTGDSGAHRGAVGTNGGRNNKIINNVLLCEGTGCSAAIPMYGDFAPVDGMLVEHNLLATTGSYCTYGGSLASKPYPNGSNIKFIDNHYSTRFMPTCGRFGTHSGFANNVRGNEARGNVWHETGLPVKF